VDFDYSLSVGRLSVLSFFFGWFAVVDFASAFFLKKTRGKFLKISAINASL